MSERDWINTYIRPLVHADGAAALHDDVAILSSRSGIIASMDSLVEGVHFLTSDPLETVGRKLIRVNVSDIYAKGAKPLECLLSVAWPNGRSESHFAELMRGIGADLQEFNLNLLGGDFVSTTGPLVLSLTITGACIGANPIRRVGNVCAGDRLWVSGEIGHGGLGLEAALTNGPSELINRYRIPPLPDMIAAEIISSKASVSMDVSDGLLQDAHTLVSVNDLGVVIDLDKVPFARRAGGLDDLLKQAAAGDDYQILAIAPSETLDLGEGFTQIGIVEAKPGLRLIHNGAPVNLPSTLGFEH